ncbi:MAG TPA: DUF1097 domain-containing protein [Chitinophagaceae bacterium]|nr:DUF1097 domain-containing protein [Chitinophagaceae bacterium]
MKTFFVGLILGLFGAVAVSISFALQWPTWVMFVAWVSYYLFGKTLKTSLPVLIQIASGILMGLLIQISGKWLSGYIGAVGLPVAVFFFIGSLAYISQLKILNSIPACFLGLIIFFGVHPPIEPLPIIELFIPIIAGFLFAWLNDSAVQQVIHRNHSVSQH